MASLITALITLACICAGTILGSLMRDRLPDHHLRDDSRDVIKTASGMIATLVALVIGLLVSSSKSTYDQASGGVTQIGAKLILLNRLLERYGPETKAIREHMREGVATTVEQLWPSDGVTPGLAAIENPTGMDGVQDLILQLEPKDEAQRLLRTHAVTTSIELAHWRWLIIEQAQEHAADGVPRDVDLLADGAVRQPRPARPAQRDDLVLPVRVCGVDGRSHLSDHGDEPAARGGGADLAGTAAEGTIGDRQGSVKGRNPEKCVLNFSCHPSRSGGAQRTKSSSGGRTEIGLAFSSRMCSA